MHRRQFFNAVGAVLAPPVLGYAFNDAFSRASAIVRDGAIGRVAFGRASDSEWLRVAREICGHREFVLELAPVGSCLPGAVLLGSDATLVIDRKGCRLLP
ncbi:MAG: hypothetical protein JO336_09340 [Acidobacteriia bacterium]|nr:hypothetical protein [Terriglobia bacterium]